MSFTHQISDFLRLIKMNFLTQNISSRISNTCLPCGSRKLLYTKTTYFCSLKVTVSIVWILNHKTWINWKPWRLMSSGMRQSALQKRCTDVSGDPAASIISDESTLMMETAGSAETSVQTTWCHIPEVSNFDSHCHGNLKAQKQKPI